MQRIYPGKGIRFLFQERTFEILEELQDKVRAADKTFGGERIFAREDLLIFLESGELRFEEWGRNTKLVDGIRQSTYADIDMLPKSLKDVVDFRFRAIKPILNFKGSLEPELKKRSAELAVMGENASSASLRRWLNYFRDSGGDRSSLISNVRDRGPRGSKLQAEVDTFIEQSIDRIYKRREKITVETVLDDVIYKIDVANKDPYRRPDDLLNVPSESTIRRRILEYDPYEMTKAKEGSKRAFEKYGQVNLREKPKRPLERVEMDHTELDFFVVDEEKREIYGRPYLTTVLDCATGYPLGIYLGFEPPSYTSVMLALKHAISSKSYIKERFPSVQNAWLAHGVPDMLVVDNGKDFLSKHLADACMQLGIELKNTPVKKPWYKGQVERYFGTINRGLLHQNKGTSFSNVIERNDYDPEKNACVDISSLLEMIHIWICDIYTQKPSKGVKGVPAKLWEEKIKLYGSPALPSSKLDWEIALMKIGDGTIQDTGIQHDNLHYQSKEFAELRRLLQAKPKKQRKVRFKIDPTDISKMYVYDEFNDKYIEAYVVEKEYAMGLNQYSHKVAVKMLRMEGKKINRVSLAYARKKIAEIMEGQGKKTKISTRKKIARMKGVGSDKEIVRSQSETASSAKPTEKKKPKRSSKANVRQNVVQFPQQGNDDDWGVFSAKRY